MKLTILLSLLIQATSLTAQIAEKVEVTEPAANKDNLLPNQKAFLNLPEENRKEFIKHLTEANRLFQQKRIFEVMEELAKAEKIFADSPEIFNIRGSCFVEMRAFDKAMAEFQKAKTFSVNNPSIDFNIAEVYFVTKRWKEAAELFEKILKVIPPQNTALGRLVEFKILLSKKKLGLDDEVTILAGKYDDNDDSPFYYFTQAALAFDAKEMEKAENWLAMAGRIFQDPNTIAPWQDTLVEFGYLKSFYGDDSAPVE